MKRPEQISWSQAALAGLLFAIAMCVWRYLTDDDGFDELAMRFAAYFTAFSLGFYFLYNLIARRDP